MKIRKETIPPEGLDIEEQEPARIMAVKGHDIRFTRPVDVAINVNLASGNLLVKGSVKTEAELVCSRCLKKVRQELSNNNFNIITELGAKTEIDITPEIREGILIQVPMKPLCGFDCRGLCPNCGQDLNEKECGCDRSKHDIQWKELDKLSSAKKVQ